MCLLVLRKHALEHARRDIALSDLNPSLLLPCLPQMPLVRSALYPRANNESLYLLPDPGEQHSCVRLFVERRGPDLVTFLMKDRDRCGVHDSP